MGWGSRAGDLRVDRESADWEEEDLEGLNVEAVADDLQPCQ